MTVGITSGSQIRINNFYFDARLNLTWTVYSKPKDPFSPTTTTFISKLLIRFHKQQKHGQTLLLEQRTKVVILLYD